MSGLPRLSLAGLFQPTVLLALALMAIITMMILPMPAWLLDLGLALSFALAILVFTTVLFIERPLDFSAFPTILLASLMLRLSLNVASTKLIIGEGHTGPQAAGGVIEGFAMFIMGGNLFLGLVVFGVLLIVNFVVITKGAGRMAEVGARFALDGMPGRQLAIDSDVASGAISHKEAKERRRREQEETTFFGSLDGASKFVKGDAVAGLLITILNLLMGFAMGVFVHDLDLARAAETYAILTVGDGLVSQIPSVITSIAAALLLSKGGVVGSADRALLAQLGGHPAALGTVAALLALLAFLPGLPFVPFILGAAGLAVAAVFAERSRAAAEAEAALPPPQSEPPAERPLGDLLDIDEIHVRFAPDLIAAVMEPATGLERRIVNMRKHIATEYGFVMPEVRLTDDAGLPAGSYAILVQGVETARAVLRPGRVLVLLRDDIPCPIAGEAVAEPVYGVPARWIPEAEQEEAAALGLATIAPGEVVATHLLETVQGEFPRLFTRRALRKLIDAYRAPSDPARAAANQRLFDEFVPDKVPLDLLQTLLRTLLSERVSIRNLPLILEAAAEGKGAGLGPEEIVELARRRIGFQIVAALTDPGGRLPLIQLGADWEALFDEHDKGTAGAPDIALPPEAFNRLASAVGRALAQAAERGSQAAIAVPGRRRRFLRQVLEAKGIRAPVLAFEEIGGHADLALLGTA